jgi:regulator of sigma E protease
MNLMLSIDGIAIARAALPFLGILFALVIIHEMGHFLAAKIFGIKVLEFGIGLPPRIKGLGFKRGETEYTLNWLPLGGFVRLLGEEDPTDPRSLAAAAKWKRLTVLCAGVVMNLVLAVILFSVGFMIPRDRSVGVVSISEVLPGTPAAIAQVEGVMQDGSEPLQGLQPGDIIYSVNGREILNPQELGFVIRRYLGNIQEWQILRDGSSLQISVLARWDPPSGQGPTGLLVGSRYPYTDTVWYYPWDAVPRGWQAMVDTIVLTKNEIQLRLAGSEAALSAGEPLFTGPVGIAEATGDVISKAGWRSLIELTALLSLNLGIFNILPIPMLDGGRVMFVVLEIVRGGRRISPEREALVHLMGFSLLIAGVVAITYFDVIRLFT